MFQQVGISVRDLPPGYEVIHGEYSAVTRELRRAWHAGEVALTHRQVMVGPDGRTAYAVVRRLRPARPAWHRAVRPAALALAVAAGLLLVGWLVVTVVTSVAGAVVASAAALTTSAYLCHRSRRRSYVEVVQRVTFRDR